MKASPINFYFHAVLLIFFTNHFIFLTFFLLFVIDSSSMKDLYLSSSPDSQNVSVELSVRLPTIACLLEALISMLGVRSFKVSTQLVTWKAICQISSSSFLSHPHPHRIFHQPQHRPYLSHHHPCQLQILQPGIPTPM